MTNSLASIRIAAVILLAVAKIGFAAAPEGTVIWNTPSTNSSGSMPVGNGDIGLNVWAQPDGDLCLLIGKTDAWDENARLLKVGRLRLHFSQQPFAKGKPFRQTLRPDRGEIEIVAGEPGNQLRARIWVDANLPVARIETDSDRDIGLETHLELWRTTSRTLTPSEADDEYVPGQLTAAGPTVVTADQILDLPDALGWRHRNETSVWQATLRHQGLESLIPEFHDPLLGSTTGAIVTGENLGVADRTTLRSKTPAKRFVVNIYPFTAQTPSAAAWLERVRQQADAVGQIPIEEARAKHRAWWRAFWDRSPIVISGTPEADAVGQMYAIQRFMSAGASRGRYPLKFNGSIFNMDGVGLGADKSRTYNADFRAWGGCYWFQNTRLVYWPMLMAGDFELMRPLFRMYREALPLAQQRTQIYFHHAGAFFPETMTFWGTYANSNYGYDRTGKQPSDVQNTYIRRYWQGGIELLAMMLDYHAFTQEPQFRDETLLPLARSILTFYGEHYPRRDADGKMIFDPAQSIETYHVAVNPLPEIAGLRWVIDGLLAVPGVSTEDKAAWTALRELLPPLPSRSEGTKKYLLPARTYDATTSNSENPELYAVFPYRLLGVGKPDLGLGLDTFAHRRFKCTGCWYQDAIQAALLGLTDDARRDVVRNCSGKDPQCRFIGFLGPYSDWTPDVDGGGVALIALQRMLLQSDGRRLLLLPAWPKQWDVHFQLHAPEQTTVECVYRHGKIESLKVTPQSRKTDVELMMPGVANPTTP